MDIYKKLVELKKRKKWTNYKIAKECNLPQATVDNIYKQRNTPQIETLKLLCDGFGITLSQFFLEDERDSSLSKSQIEFLDLFNLLSEEKKDALKTIMIFII